MNKIVTSTIAGTTAAAALPFASPYLPPEVNAAASQIISGTPIEQFYNIEQTNADPNGFSSFEVDSPSAVNFEIPKECLDRTNRVIKPLSADCK